MGLEAGWNCHISLLNDKATPGRSDMSSNTSHMSRADSNATHHTHRRSVMLHLRVLDEARAQHRRRSAPGIVHLTNSHNDLNTTTSPASVTDDKDVHITCDDSIDDTFVDPLLPAGDRDNDNCRANVDEGILPVISSKACASPVQSLMSGSLNPELKVHDCHERGDSDTHSNAVSSYMTDYSDSVIGGLGLANTVSNNASYLNLPTKTKLEMWYFEAKYKIVNK